MSINTVNISGNLTRDSELRATASGSSVLKFGVAVNDRVRNQQTGEWEDRPNFVDCQLWGKRADALKERLVKGTKVCVSGRLRYESWQAKDGAKRSRLVVNVDEVELLGSQDARQMLKETFGSQMNVYEEEDVPF